MNRLVCLTGSIVFLGALISLGDNAPPATQPATQPATAPTYQIYEGPARPMAETLQSLFGDRAEANAARARADAVAIKQALTTFEVDNGRMPTTAEGLQALVTNPAKLPDWKKLIGKLPLDPWGNPYIYRCPGANGNDFDIYSTGPNGRDEHGGGDDIN